MAEGPDRVVGTLGIDVGGTRVKTSLVTEDGWVVREWTEPTPADLGQTIAGRALDWIGRAHREHPEVSVEALGVAVPGIVDEEAGVCRLSANLGWRDLDVAGPLAAATGRPVRLGHDVRSGLVGEVACGAAKGHDQVLFLTIGTGLAAALMVDGRLLVGRGWAGEIGHAVVRPGGPPCGCGASGCLEAVASASAIGRIYSARMGLAAPVDAAEVSLRAQTGDTIAAAVWLDAAQALALAVHFTAVAAGSRIVVIGGGLSNAGEVLLGPLREALAARATVVEAPEVVRAELGDRAGSIGAALMAGELLA